MKKVLCLINLRIYSLKTSKLLVVKITFCEFPRLLRKACSIELAPALQDGATGVDDVLHDQDVLAADRVVDALHADDLHL